MCPVARSTEVACPLKRKWEPEGKACFLLFPNGWVLWNPAPHIHTVQHSLPGSGTIPQYVRVITSLIEGEGGCSTEQTIAFAVSECYRRTTVPCSTTTYTRFQHSHSGIIISMAMNWKAFSVKCYFAEVGLIPSVQNDSLV